MSWVYNGTYDASHIAKTNTEFATYIGLDSLFNTYRGDLTLHSFVDSEKNLKMISPCNDVFFSGKFREFLSCDLLSGNKKITLDGVEYSIILPNVDELTTLFTKYTGSNENIIATRDYSSDGKKHISINKRGSIVEDWDSQTRVAIPILIGKTNKPPTFKGLVDTNLGEISEKPANINFTLNDEDISDTLTLLINVDGETYDSHQSDTNTLTCDFEFSFFDTLSYGNHTITFVGMDSKMATVSVNITFKKIKEPILTISEDSDLQFTALALKELDNEIAYQCDKVSNFLKSNDISVLPIDGLSTMIDKVIEKGFGKKFATGYAQVDSDYTRLKYYGGINDDTAWCARITGLKFKPSIIFIYYGYSNNCYYGSIYIDTPIVSGALSFGSKTQYSNRESASFFGSNNSQLNPSEGVYLVPTHNSAFSGQQVRWIAFE